MQQLRYDTKIRRFVFDCEKEERFPASYAGFKYNHPSAPYQWTTEQPDIAIKLAEFVYDPFTVGKLNEYIDAYNASMATTADVDIPSPKGMNYLPYQKAGIVYAAERSNTLIGDDPGLGKTIQAIGVINLDKSIEKILIVCPGSVALNWKKELERWLVDSFDSISIFTAKSPVIGDITIISYEMLARRIKEVADDYDLLIVDEVTMIKNPAAKRTKAIEMLINRCGRKLFLTGTPVENHLKELYTLLNLLAPYTWNNYAEFERKYIEFRYNKSKVRPFPNPDTMPELKAKLRSTLMLRREIHDVRDQVPFPDVLLQPVILEHDIIDEQLETELYNWKQLQNYIENLEVSAENDLHLNEALDGLDRQRKVFFQSMSKLRHHTGLLKVPFVTQFVDETLEASEDGYKIVVFCHHTDVVNDICAGLSKWNAVKFYGEMSQEQRQ
jgi:SWI/SNF-related matrix-associated actin-dependent regulator 1 of chromatin subfamily A